MTKNSNVKQKMEKITTFLFDVDGVMTNSDITLIDNKMVRTMNAKDGFAIQFAIKKGYRIGVITGGKEKEAIERLHYLGITDIYLNSMHKIKDFEHFLKKYDNITPENVLYMGDDLPDLPIMLKVGLSTAPKDSCTEILSMADYVSPFAGGRGCVRDVIEQVLLARGDWDYMNLIKKGLPAST